MQKIKTVFVRDYSDPKRPVLTREVTPGCEWVLAGEGIATRKYDGTCVLIRRDGMAIRVFTRREVKPGQATPEGFFPLTTDETTGKVIGWLPSEGTQFEKFIREALLEDGKVWEPGTYELVGPKINGNPEGYDKHRLIKHERAEESLDDRDHSLRDYDAIRDLVLGLAQQGWEGIVYHGPAGKFAKIKARDFR